MEHPQSYRITKLLPNRWQEINIFVQQDHPGKNRRGRHTGDEVPAVQLHLLHPGAALAAVVAAAFHRQRQLIRPAERRNEQRNENGQQRLGPLHHAAAFQVCAPCLLSGHDLVRLLDEGGDKPQRDGHHHGQLVHRQLDLLKGRQQPLYAVGEGDGRGGIGQQRGARDEAQNSDRHEYRRLDALPGDLEELPLPQRVAGGKEQVQHRRKDDDGHHRLHGFPDHRKGNTADKIGREAEQHAQQQAPHVIRHKQHHDVEDGKQDLDAGVHFVNGALPGEILTNGNISDHRAAPPFTAFRIAAAAPSTV